MKEDKYYCVVCKETCSSYGIHSQVCDCTIPDVRKLLYIWFNGYRHEHRDDFWDWRLDAERE